MKKILAILYLTGIIITTSSTFISCNIKLIKKDLPTIENIILDKTHTQADAKKSVQEKLADASGLTEKQIQDDKNLSYKFYNNDKTELSDNDKTELSDNDKLYSGQKYEIKITANEDDQYFHKDSSIIDVNVTKFNLATANIVIESFKTDSEGEVHFLHLFIKVIDKLEVLSGLLNQDLWDHWKTSDYTGNDFLIVEDSSGKKWRFANKNDHLAAQTYKIILTALNNDQYFTGTKTIEIIVTLK